MLTDSSKVYVAVKTEDPVEAAHRVPVAEDPWTEVVGVQVGR